MKKTLIAAIAAVTLASCATTPKAFITANLTNAEDQKVYITELLPGDNKYTNTDSTDMVDGKFTMELSNSYPRQVIITFANTPQAYKHVVIDNGTLTIDGDINDLPNAAIGGTDIAKKITALTALISPINDSIMAINKEYASVTASTLTDIEKAVQVEALRARYNAFYEQMTELNKQSIEDNKDNVFGAYLASQQGSVRSYEDAVAVLESLSLDKMPDNQFVDNLKDAIAKFETTRPGAEAPDFTLQTPEGEDFSLSSLRGKVVLVDFWASWCSPCRASNPGVVELYNKYKDNGFTVLGVSYDNNKENWLKAIEEDGLTWDHISALQGWSCPTVQLYSVAGIPHTVLIDKDGTIVAHNLHGEELDAKVAELTK